MELLLAFAVIALLTWSAVVYRRLTIAQGLLGVLVIGSCLGHDFYHRNVGPLPLTLDRVLWGIVFLHFAVMLLRRQIAIDSLRLADWTMIGLLGWFMLNMAMTQYSYNGMQPVSLFLFFLLMPAGSYIMGRYIRFDERDFRALYWGAILFGSYLAVTAIAESRDLTAFVFPRYISDPSFVEFLGRGRGPFLNPVANGIVQTACLLIGLSQWPRAGRRGRFWLMAFACLMLAGCYSTLTRTVWIGTAFALSMFVFVNLPTRRRIVFLASMVLCGGLFLGGAWEHIKSFKRDKNVSVEDMEQSARLRPLLASVAWRMAQDQPITGHGFGQYRLHAQNYHYGGDPAPWEDGTEPTQMVLPYVQHNVVLSVLVDLGLVGLILFLLLFAAWTWQAWQVWRSNALALWQRSFGLISLTLISGYMINGMFHDVLIVPMVNMFVFTITGMTGHIFHASVAARAEKGQTFSTEPPRFARPWDSPVGEFAAPRKP